MNNLNVTIADLGGLADAYFRRAAANGAGHPDNEYLNKQGSRFALASNAIALACRDAARHASLSQPELAA
jgi:hypothetical protein